MYSKNKNMHSESYHNLTPPPGYDGSRLFTRRERSDGRDESFVVHTRPIYRGRDKDREYETHKINDNNSKAKEAAPGDAIYEDAPVVSDPFPPFPGVEAFLDEPEDFWEEETPDTVPASSDISGNQTDSAESSSPGTPQNKSARFILPEPLAGLLNGLEREDLLLIGLILLLSADKSMRTGDILLLLALLLVTK